jgi:hypothetical protein
MKKKNIGHIGQIKPSEESWGFLKRMSLRKEIKKKFRLKHTVYCHLKEIT